METTASRAQPRATYPALWHGLRTAWGSLLRALTGEAREGLHTADVLASYRVANQVADS